MPVSGPAKGFDVVESASVEMSIEEEDRGDDCRVPYWRTAAMPRPMLCRLLGRTESSL